MTTQRKNRFLNNGWFLIFVSGIVLLVYTYFYHVEPNKDTLKVYQGTLKTTPRTETHGGDMEYNYLLVTMNEYERDFIFRSCAFNKLDFQAVDNLSVGENIEIIVENDRIVNDAYYSVSFNSLNGLSLLKYELYLSCYLNEWKIGLLLVVIGIIGLSYDALKRNLFSSR